MPQSPPGAYHCPHDADDRRDRLPGHPFAGRGGDGAGEGGALLWHCGETGVPHALQCDHHGDHLAYGCHQKGPALEAAAGHRKCAAQDYVFLNYLRCHDDIGWGLDYAVLTQQRALTSAPTRNI